MNTVENRQLFATASNRLGELVASIRNAKSVDQADRLSHALYGACSMAHALGLISVEQWSKWLDAGDNAYYRAGPRG